MYELLLFTGGVYKFNEFKEFIEDIGGLIIEMESFKISRGIYFLSEEINVLILAPVGEKEEIEFFAKNIKGSIEQVKMEEKESEKVIIIFEIYKKLKINKLSSIDEIVANLIDNNEFIKIKNRKNEITINKEEFLEKITNLLILMEEMEIIKRIEKEKTSYFKIKK
ncbi:hypothetical protein SDC9_08626 [bioreactor metagenome]|uniref:Uncharacterized protein n=1 Tax=bioreactor metagenome TaxID=1076179 RepID=A0A644T7T6_9ZZZZ|nr:methyl-coenzyme M reductase family protein [Methanobrevibacter sp.]MEA4957664.1 methyl-coenzyme M reductase family protein [Methanobrevibacter sp.]